MSGGNSKPDSAMEMIHQREAKDDGQLSKSYRDAVKSKRIEILPDGR
jgi:hypothetical protein